VREWELALGLTEFPISRDPPEGGTRLLYSNVPHLFHVSNF